MSQSPNEFYADRGLVRTSITLHPNTINYLKITVDALNESLGKGETKLTQGELVDALCRLIQQNDNVEKLLLEKLEEVKVEKANARQEMLDKKRQARQLLKEGKLDHLLGE